MVKIKCFNSKTDSYQHSKPSSLLLKYYSNKVQWRLLKLKQRNINQNFNFHQINFELLLVFYSVVLCGGIGLASKHLSMTQPAVSLCIQKIEKKLGCIIFKGTTIPKLLKLTIPGLILFNYTQRLFQLINDSLLITRSFNFYPLAKASINIFKVNNTRITIKNKYCSYNLQFFLKKRFTSSLNSLIKFTSIKLSDNKNQSDYKLLNNFSFSSKQRQPFFYSKEYNIKIFKNPLLKNTSSNTLQQKVTIEIQTSVAVTICRKLKVKTFLA